MKKLENSIHWKNFNFNELNILTIIFNTIIYLSNIIKSNWDKYKSALYNRGLFIVSQTHTILISFDSLIKNFILIYFN